MIRRRLSLLVFVLVIMLSACGDSTQKDDDKNELETMYPFLEEIILTDVQKTALSETTMPIVIGYIDDSKMLIQEQGLWVLYDGDEIYRTTEVTQAQGYFISFDPTSNVVFYANTNTDRVSEFDLDGSMTYGELSDLFGNITFSDNFVTPTMYLYNGILYGTNTVDQFPQETGKITYVIPSWEKAIGAFDTGDGQCIIHLYDDVFDTTSTNIEVSSSLNWGEFQYMKNGWRVYALYDQRESRYEGYFAINSTGNIQTYFPDEHLPVGISMDFNSEETIYNRHLRGIIFSYEENNTKHYVITSEDLSVVGVFEQSELDSIIYFGSDYIMSYEDTTLTISDHSDSILYTYTSSFERIMNLYFEITDDYIIINETNTFGKQIDIVDRLEYISLYSGEYNGYTLFDDEIYLFDDNNDEYLLNQQTWTVKSIGFNNANNRKNVTGDYLYQIDFDEVTVFEKDGTLIETFEVVGYITSVDSYSVLIKIGDEYFVLVNN